MRVLRLRFKNLNSLAGVWDIDFTHPDYVSSGIFAIIGPTGAGKTTILDAICLALYGQTPRLDRITQSDNEIMSRQTGECFAEIEIETAKGRFRCHWSQHRSRRLADGQLQSPKHEIAEASSGVILESKLKAVAARVEDVTGMDFDRFTRSMLLAQGGFAAFLQAGPDQRAPILEQITGTEIYSRISIKVHERTSEERRKLAELRAELDGIQLLTQEEEQLLRSELSERQTQELALVAEVGVVREARAWREKIAALESELVQLDQTWLNFTAEKSLSAPELERLELAVNALKISGEHAHLAAARKQQEIEVAELQGSEERLPLLQQQWQAAFDGLELAELQLADDAREQSQGAELIRATRELDLRLAESMSRLKGLSEEIDGVRRQSGGYRQEMATCAKRLSEFGSQLGVVEQQLNEHQADAGLVEALTGIEQQFKNLGTLDLQCRDNQKRVSQQVAVIAGFKDRFDQAEKLWKRAVQALSEAGNKLELLGNSREALLQGRELTLWRDQAETLAGRLVRLAALGEAAGRIEEVEQRLTQLKSRGAGLEQKQAELQLQEEKLTGEHLLREQLVRQLQDKVVLLNRVRDLEEERAQLVDGAPCPLCGSAEHPYAVGNVPQPDAVQQELELAIAESKGVAAQLADIRLLWVSFNKDLEQLRLDQVDCQLRLERDQACCKNGFEELDLDCAAGNRANVVRQESGACQTMLVNLREVINRAEQLERSEQGARTLLDKAREDLSSQEKVRLAASLGHESSLTELKRLQDESVVLGGDLDHALAVVENAVEPYGYREIVVGKADQMLAALTERRTAWLQRTQAREYLEKGRAEVAAEQEKLRALLTEAERVLADKEQQLLERSAQREGLVEQRLELYGERNPDSEERRLAEALRQSAERREAALQEKNRLQAELDILSRQIYRLISSINERAGQLTGLEQAFGLRLAEASFAGEATFLESCLPKDHFDKLLQWAEDLRNRETVLQTRQHDCRTALALEQGRNLSDKDLEQLREESEAVAGGLSELQKELGALGQRLRQHAEQQQRHHSRIQEIEARKQECERWERLHSLIGSGDGKKFRNFAQGLTFELMVAHANRQLQKMSDRYILVRDNAEPLELNVIDNYRAGDIRSTRNLSGGESFIASLALSLGLSSMASHNVRVDSLFLDEGFGTLDEDALETALETLSALQQEGKLIGIISHVPALKERIGTQIQVEAGSAGRSTLSGPGCSRS